MSSEVVAAQGTSLARYRFGADTLRYVEQTDGRVTMQTPGGPTVVQSTHDARISIRGVGNGHVQAWYDRITLRQQGPGPAVHEPATDAIIGKPFAVSVSETGLVTTHSSPPMPAAIAAVTDLSREFDDFFLTVPLTPVVIGLEWADTIVRTQGGRPDSTTTSRHVRSYRAIRDTSVGGTRAVVIAVRQLVREESTTPLPGQPMQVRSRLEGEQRGTAVFVLASGRLHSRERRGILAGELTIVGGPQPARIPQRFEYTSTLTLQAVAR